MRYYLLLILAAIGLRLLFLDADPATDLTWSGVLLTDEGWYSTNAVNKALFGHWFIPYVRNALSHFPLFSLFQYLSFSIFGVGLFSLRLISLIFSVLTILLFITILSEPSQKRIALILFVTNYFFLMYSRLGLIDVTLGFFLLLAAWCWLQAWQRQKRLYFLGAGVITALSILTIKSSAFFFPVAYIFASLYMVITRQKKIGVNAQAQPENARQTFLAMTRPTGKGRRTGLPLQVLGFDYAPFLFFILGVIVVFVLWLYLWLLPHLRYWYHFYRTYVEEQGQAVSLLNIGFNLGHFFGDVLLQFDLPLLLLMALFQALKTISRAVRRLFGSEATGPANLTTFMALWFLCGYLAFALLPYHPPRLVIALMPPIIFLSTEFLLSIKRAELRISFKRDWPVLLSWAAINAWGLSFFISSRFKPITAKLPLVTFALCLLPAMLIIIGIAVWLFGKLLNRLLELPNGPQTLYTLSIIIIIGLNVILYGRYLIALDYSMKRTAQEVGELAYQETSQPVLMGQIANTLALENHLFTVSCGDYEYYEEQILKYYQPTHLITLTDKELQRLKEQYPWYFQQARLIKKFRLLNNYYTGQDISLYSLK